VEKVKKVIWTNSARVALMQIFGFHVSKSELAAETIINDIINTADSIVFAHQYQVDTINPKYRRMIVRQYKIIYKAEGNIVFIMNIVSTRINPIKLKEM